MSVNSTTDSSLPPHSSNSSLSPFLSCFRSTAGIFTLSALTLTHILCLPVFILVLCLGYHRRRRRRSASTPCDLFTYHCCVMQLNEFTGIIMMSCGSYQSLNIMQVVGFSILNITAMGKTLFHILTCVERYLAVCHPIMYLGLRQARGVRITNISIGCVYVLSFTSMVSFYEMSSQTKTVLMFSIMSLCLIATWYCSVFVLCALKRPAPGEVGGNRERVDQSKQRAFYTIMAIMGVLLLKFGGNNMINVMLNTGLLIDSCSILMSLFWFDLPSTLVLPLLFLQRAGKLHCGRPNTESE